MNNEEKRNEEIKSIINSLIRIAEYLKNINETLKRLPLSIKEVNE